MLSQLIGEMRWPAGSCASRLTKKERSPRFVMI